MRDIASVDLSGSTKTYWQMHMAFGVIRTMSPKCETGFNADEGEIGKMEYPGTKPTFL
jgi:hypothetical protein